MIECIGRIESMWYRAKQYHIGGSNIPCRAIVACSDYRVMWNWLVVHHITDTLG